MTASNKVDLLVKEDGSISPLLPPSPKSARKVRKRNRSVELAFLSLFLIAMLVGVITFFVVMKPGLDKAGLYEFNYPQNQRSWCGTVAFEQDDAVEVVTTENVVTVSDGLEGKTAVKINTSSDGSPSFLCLLRDDDKYAMSGPRILPRANVLDKMMKQTNDGTPLDLVMGNDLWVPDELTPVDVTELPKVIQELCDGIPTFTMQPMQLDPIFENYLEFYKDFYDIDLDDDDFTDEYDEGDEEEMAIAVIPGQNEDENAVESDGAVKDYLQYVFPDIFNISGDFYDYSSNTSYEYAGEPILIDEDDSDDQEDLLQYEGIDKFMYDSAEINPSGEDEYANLEDAEPTFPASTTEEPQYSLFRKKRQAIEEEDEEDSQPTEEEEEESEPNQSNSQSLNLGESQTDADLSCCQHCTRVYLQCSRICVPIQQGTFPYYYRSCNHVQCNMILPCTWWYARFLGQV